MHSQWREGQNVSYSLIITNKRTRWSVFLSSVGSEDNSRKYLRKTKYQLYGWEGVRIIIFTIKHDYFISRSRFQNLEQKSGAWRIIDSPPSVRARRAVVRTSRVKASSGPLPPKNRFYFYAASCKIKTPASIQTRPLCFRSSRAKTFENAISGARNVVTPCWPRRRTFDSPKWRHNASARRNSAALERFTTARRCPLIACNNARLLRGNGHYDDTRRVDGFKRRSRVVVVRLEGFKVTSTFDKI